MGEKLTHADACRLSRAFNEVANLGNSQDRAINEWLKSVIAAAKATEAPPVDTRHRFVPARKYPWFCGVCGYAPHEALMHIQDETPGLAALSEKGRE